MEILLLLTLTNSQGKKQFNSKGWFHFLPVGCEGLGELTGCLRHSGLENELTVKAKELIPREQKLKLRKALFLRQNK